jgi:hypothetical protein
VGYSHIAAAGGLWYIATIWSYSIAIEISIICCKKSMSVVYILCNVVHVAMVEVYRISGTWETYSKSGLSEVN